MRNQKPGELNTRNKEVGLFSSFIFNDCDTLGLQSFDPLGSEEVLVTCRSLDML